MINLNLVQGYNEFGENGEKDLFYLEKSLDDLNVDEMIPYFFNYIKNHKFLVIKKMANSFIFDFTDLTYNSSEYSIVRNRISKLLGILILRLKKMALVEKYNQRTYRIKDNMVNFQIRLLYNQSKT